MSCNCCPPIIFGSGGGEPGPAGPPGPEGPAGPPGESACISADAGNQLVEGSDGCMYVPAPPALTLDPQECNAAHMTGDRLLVPRTDLTGVVGNSPAATGTDRSVDIDVTETPGCPHVWAVGARLTPPSGFLNTERQHADLLAAAGTDVPIPESDIVLPEAGVYHIDADVRYALGTDTGGSGYIIGWLNDETAGTLLTSFTQIAAVNSPAGQEHQGGTTHIMTEYAVASGPRTVRLHLMFVPTGGTMTAAQAGGTDSNGATRVRYLKVRD